MFLLIFVIIILATILYYIYNFKDELDELENDSSIPRVSGWSIMWAFLRQLPHDEVEEVISKTSGGRGIYMV